MKTLLAPCLLAALLVPVGPAGADTGKVVDPGAGDDVADVVFFTDARPVLIRLHLFVGKEAAVGRWTAYMRRWFQYLDVDGNGTLSAKELARAPDPGQLQMQMTSYGVTYRPGYKAPSLKDVDADTDDRVTPDELLSFYRNSAAGPVHIGPVPGRTGPDLVGAQLFRYLDANGDGRVSEEEARRAPATLARLDLDDNEILLPQEIQPGANLTGFGQVPQQMMGGPVAPAGLPLLLVPREAAANRVALRLRVARGVLERLDRDRDQKLSRREIHLPDQAFADLDRNRDDHLDPLELLRWIIARPDFEITVHLGEQSSSVTMVQKPDEGPADTVLRTETGAVAPLQVDNTQVRLVAQTTPGAAMMQAGGLKRSYLQMFQRMDTAKKGVLTPAQLADRRYAFFAQIASAADRDGDGSLTEQELITWLDLLGDAGSVVVSLGFIDQGKGLFDLIDRDQDGRLSIRELKHAWSSLASLPGKDGGAVRAADIPRQCQLIVARGGLSYRTFSPGRVVAMRPGVPQAGTPAPARGPAWFHKMDRNGDGDVSRREFLGRPEQLARIDADGDEVISLAEAEEAEKRLRQDRPER